MLWLYARPLMYTFIHVIKRKSEDACSFHWRQFPAVASKSTGAVTIQCVHSGAGTVILWSRSNLGVCKIGAILVRRGVASGEEGLDFEHAPGRRRAVEIVRPAAAQPVEPVSNGGGGDARHVHIHTWAESARASGRPEGEGAGTDLAPPPRGPTHPAPCRAITMAPAPPRARTRRATG